ncbi:unnamed protein product [Strongylus vulgaris]|uniref:Uncharacterized protein n=1 Tax=Strongylus vulgaris TaxID=40348 RepID=A0A3P7K4D1_STRVU|nr:unnamed protein product [Strongylus vulgaris]
MSNGLEEKSHQCPPGRSAFTLEELFADRYSKDNESFAKICEGFEPVICLHPFHSRPKRNFDNNSGQHQYWRGRGGWNRGRGDGREGGGRGNWRDRGREARSWQSNDPRGQRRPWNDGYSRRSDDGERRFCPR